jgi:hypothetical protein
VRRFGSPLPWCVLRQKGEAAQRDRRPKLSELESADVALVDSHVRRHMTTDVAEQSPMSITECGSLSRAGSRHGLGYRQPDAAWPISYQLQTRPNELKIHQFFRRARPVPTFSPHSHKGLNRVMATRTAWSGEGALRPHCQRAARLAPKAHAHDRSAREFYNASAFRSPLAGKAAQELSGANGVHSRISIDRASGPF